MRIGGAVLVSFGFAGIVFRKRIIQSNVTWDEARLDREISEQAKRAISFLTLLIALFFVVLGSVTLLAVV